MKRFLHDDGTSISVDLHGFSVADAERLLREIVRIGAARGRSSVRVIHGSSTSDPLARNPSIKHLLDDLLAGGALPAVIDSFTTGDVTLLGLRPGGRADRRRILPADVW